MGEEDEYNFVYPNNYEIEELILTLLSEKYGTDSPEYQIVDKFIDVDDKSIVWGRESVLKTLQKTLESNNVENIKKSLEEINDVLTSLSEKRKAQRKAEREENELIQKYITNFNEMLAKQNITIKFEPNGTVIYARRNDTKLGYIRLLENINYSSAIHVASIKRLKDGEKGIGEIMIEWLVIDAYRRGIDRIGLDAVPTTESNVKISLDPLRLFKYYENIGFEKSNNSNKTAISYNGNIKKMLLKFLKQRKANLAGGGRRNTTYKQRSTRRRHVSRKRR